MNLKKIKSRYLLILTISYLFFVLVSVDASVKSEHILSEDLLIAQGIEALNRSDYSKAEQLFQEALKEDPLNPEALYYLGITYSRTGQYTEAEGFLLKALSIIGENDYIYLELGRLYTITDECTKAVSHLRRLLNSDDRTIREGAIELLRICEPPAYGLSAYASLQYDTNVVLEPTNPPIKAPDKEDMKGVFYVDAYLRLLSTNNAKMLTRYNLYQSLYQKDDLTKFNIHYQRLNPCIRWSSGEKFSTETGYAFEYSYFGSKLYGRSHGFYFDMRIIHNRTVFSNLSYEYKKQRYWNSPLFEDNSIRSGHKHTVKGGITFRVRTLQATISGAHEWTRTKKDYWDYNGYSIGAVLRYPMQRALVGIEYEFTENHFRAPFIPTDIERKDRLHEVTLQLIYNISRGIMLILQQDYIRNISNIDVFDYKRSITSLTLKVEVL